MTLPFSFEMPPPGTPWSTNDERKMHHMVRHGFVTKWEAATRMAYRSACNRANRSYASDPAIVRVTIPFQKNRRRDPHNYCGTVLKAIIDGLVAGGCWPDDTPEWVDHVQPILSKGKVVKIELLPRL